MTATLNLETLTLEYGSHEKRSDGVCLLEAVAWFAGKQHNDAPACVSPVLRSFGISLNDRWDTAQRQKLIPFIPRMVGTAGDGQDEARCYLALDWLVRTFAPAWLDLAGLTAEAAELRALRRVADLAAAQAAGPVVRNARTKAAAAEAAARVAAWDAARVAAWDAAKAATGVAAEAAAEVAAEAATGVAAEAAAWDAAWDAAWAAAEVAAWAAAKAAARDAAWDAAWAAARDAARAAARVAAWAAAGAAAGAAARAAARDAARVAAKAALQPTVETLQASALDLFDRMINPEALTVAETAERKRKRANRRRPDPTYLRELARVFNDNPDAPAKAVEAWAGIAPATASRHIAKARDEKDPKTRKPYLTTPKATR